MPFHWPKETKVVLKYMDKLHRFHTSTKHVIVFHGKPHYFTVNWNKDFLHSSRQALTYFSLETNCEWAMRIFLGICAKYNRTLTVINKVCRVCICLWCTLYSDNYRWYDARQELWNNNFQGISWLKTEYVFQGPLLLTWFNFNPSMDK